MRKEYASLKRRPLLAPVWIFALWSLVAVGILGWVVNAASTTLVVVTRHAEKAPDGTADPPLSPAGRERAARLAGVLGAGDAAVGIDAIFVTQLKRSGATAQPLALKRNVPVVTVQADDVSGLVRRIRSDYRGRRVLVVAHSDTVPAIVNALGESSLAAPIADDEYGTVYLVAIPRWSRPSVLRLALP